MSRKTDKKAGTKKTTTKKATKRNEMMNHNAQTAANTATTAPVTTSANGQTPDPAQVIPFRQPGWEKHNPWTANQQVKQAGNGFAPVAQRFNHSRGK